MGTQETASAERLELPELARRMRMVAADCETDATSLDATPFTGRGVGEVFGNLLAMIKACATVNALLCDELVELRREKQAS